MSQIAQYVGSDAFSCTRFSLSLSLSLSLTQTTTMLPILHSLVQAKDEMVDASMMIIWVKRSKTTLVLEQESHACICGSANTDQLFPLND